MIIPQLYNDHDHRKFAEDLEASEPEGPGVEGMLIF